MRFGEWIEIDCYRILGVSKAATGEEIKKAYRRLAKQHHPDKNNGDPEGESQFKDINQAYQIIGNEEKRRQYDLYLNLYESQIRSGSNVDDFGLFLRTKGFGGCRRFGFKGKGCRRRTW